MILTVMIVLSDIVINWKNVIKTCNRFLLKCIDKLIDIN